MQYRISYLQLFTQIIIIILLKRVICLISCCKTVGENLRVRLHVERVRDSIKGGLLEAACASPTGSRGKALGQAVGDSILTVLLKW